MYVNEQYKNEDLVLWEQWKRSNSLIDLEKLLAKFDPVIQKAVNKWAGPVSREVLLNKAKILAVNAFKSYSPNKGTTLATHVTNQLAPLSRVVYTYQNTSRMPENITLKTNSYLAAKDHLTNIIGREPTADELHQELGWDTKELSRIDSYLRNDLVESAGPVANNFFDFNNEDDILAAIYFDLTPEEKVLFEHTTGYNNKPILSNPELTKKLGITQSQLSYKKTLLKNKINLLIKQQKTPTYRSGG